VQRWCIAVVRITRYRLWHLSKEFERLRYERRTCADRTSVNVVPVLELDDENENRGQHCRDRKQEAQTYDSSSSTDECGVARSQRPQSANNNVNQQHIYKMQTVKKKTGNKQHHLKPVNDSFCVQRTNKIT
jgi:hypothetical protein